MLENKRQEDVIALCRKLIQAKSYSGGEDKVSAAIKEAMTEKGFDEITIDKYGNIIGCIKGNARARRFCLTDILIRFR